MGMFHLWKCPRCWDNPCHCENDAHGDPIRYSTSLSNNSYPLTSERVQQEQLELLKEQNRLLREIAKK